HTDKVARKGADAAPPRSEYSASGACTRCGFAISGALEPRHFSFNTHVGACPECDGLGERAQCDAELLVQHPELSVYDGALDGKLARYLVKGKGYYEMLLRSVAKVHKIALDLPWRDLSDAQRALIAYGTGSRPSYRVRQERTTENAQIEEEFESGWPGLCGHVDAWHAKTEDPEWSAILERVMARRTCSACQGERLGPAARAATLGKKRMPELLRASVAEALQWAEALGTRSARVQAVAPVLEEVRSRLALLVRVGLGYLSLDRSTSTLSGGEARRVRLSASLGSRLVGVCYVLDEPTVGLHPRDVDALTDALRDLSNQGNTVIVVEHDSHLMQRADWLVDLGPGAGRHGGHIVAVGKPADVARHPTSLTARALRGELAPKRELRDARTARATERIVLRGAKHNNLKDVDFAFAFGAITGVCGPSGSGKSTLVLDTLVPALHGEAPAGRWKSLAGPHGGGVRVVVADASPIGRTPASVPATYTGLMDPLRELYARTPDARLRGFDAGRFSFNGTKGRCPACEGRGATQVEMQFLADLWLTCEECDGTRYAPEVLEIKFRNLSIAEALQLTAEEAQEFFEHQPKIATIAKTLCDVGLGYLQLGQSSTTLSGGEAQRLKLATELFQVGTHGKTAIVLDEPTTGLALSDVGYLVRVLDRLAASGAAVVVIEHHTALLAVCDELVELGPAGGQAGGRIIARGTPAELARDEHSITGPWIARELAPPVAPVAPPRKKRVAGRSPT
ncbi:MAG: excinuclease ABC subunit UvrA, partial [Planctomycetota bacterium]